MDQNNETPEDRAAIIAERQKWVEQLMDIRNDAIAKGMKLHTTDEILDALHDERAGGIGLERLWQ
jgi:hypothetical protein